MSCILNEANYQHQVTDQVKCQMHGMQIVFHGMRGSWLTTCIEWASHVRKSCNTTLVAPTAQAHSCKQTGQRYSSRQLQHTAE